MTTPVPYLLTTTIVILVALAAALSVEHAGSRWFRPRRPSAPTHRALVQGLTLALALSVALLATARVTAPGDLPPELGVLTSVVMAAGTALWLALTAPSQASSTLLKTFAAATLVLGSAAAALVVMT